MVGGRLLIDALGSAAALCSMASFPPQLVKIWREKDARSVSLRMYLVTVTGFALWLTYGLVIARWPIVVSNSVCLALSTAILVLKLRFDHAGAHPAKAGVG